MKFCSKHLIKKVPFLVFFQSKKFLFLYFFNQKSSFFNQKSSFSCPQTTIKSSFDYAYIFNTYVIYTYLGATKKIDNYQKTLR